MRHCMRSGASEKHADLHMNTNCFLRLTPAQFLRRHWQKKPLLVRGALTEYASFIDRAGLCELAARDDVVSRLVMRTRAGWEVRHGPFKPALLRKLPPRGWSLLVQGVNHVVPRAASLLQEFRFLPYARLDDIMVSYAPPGGGVGPHFDSYDVFLLQGHGTRRWSVSAQRDLELVPDAPLRILERFHADDEWLVEPGDLLYLPPRCAHDGVALDDCITISIGFRAPSTAEITARFLEHLQDTREPQGRYADPSLAPAAHPAQIGADMVKKFARMLEAIRWSRSDVTRFAGVYLTEPKPHIVFERPSRPLARSGFIRAATRHGVRLAPTSLMLFRGRTFFINGESCPVDAPTARMLRRLADDRRLTLPLDCEAAALDLLHEWYRAGYLLVGASGEAVA